MDLDKISDKLLKVLEHYLSLHQADELHDLIMDDYYLEDDCLDYIKQCENT